MLQELPTNKRTDHPHYIVPWYAILLLADMTMVGNPLTSGHNNGAQFPSSKRELVDTIEGRYCYLAKRVREISCQLTSVFLSEPPLAKDYNTY